MKLNRGLVLGAVLVAATAGYVAYGNARFSKYKPDIEKKVESYIADMCAANVKASEQGSQEPLKELVASYWEDGGSDNAFEYNCFTRADTLENLDYEVEGSGYIESMNYYIEDVDVQKYGSNCAVATVSFSTNAVFFGDPAFFDGTYNLFSYYEYSDEEYEDIDAKRQMTVEYLSYSFILKLDGGEWKIINSSMENWYSNGSELLENGSSDETKEVTEDDANVSSGDNSGE